MQIEALVVDTAVRVVKEISGDTHNRVTNYGRDITLLNSGCYYPNDYFRLLQEAKQKPRFDYFFNKGSFFHGHASPKHFTMLEAKNKPTGVLANIFVIKKGIQPSDALAALRQGLNFIGCGETCQIAFYEGIKQLIGQNKFNALFANVQTNLLPFSINWDSLKNPLCCLFMYSRDTSRYQLGDLVFFANVPLYRQKHINGEASGFFSICVDNTTGSERFTTLGLSPNGSTRQEIKEKLLNEFNTSPIGNAIVPKEIGSRITNSYSLKDQEQIARLANRLLSSQEFEEYGGGLAQVRIFIDESRMQQLAQSPIEKACMLFNSWQTGQGIRPQ